MEWSNQLTQVPVLWIKPMAELIFSNSLEKVATEESVIKT